MASPKQREGATRRKEKSKSAISLKKLIADLKLSDLVDSQDIQAMMDDFYRIAAIPMYIVDLKGELVVGVGCQDICVKFHRAHPETRKNCIQSNLHLTAGIPMGKFKLYKCMNNMWDIATPIVVGGQRMGNAFSGQFFFDDETIDYDLFRSQARRYGFDEKEYIAALEAVPRLSRKKVNTGMSFFTKIADIVASVSYSNISLGRSLAERDALMASLQESKHDLNRAQAVALTGSWRLDVRRNELTWSDQTYRLFGIPKGTTLTYEQFLDAVHPEDREYVDRKWSAAMRGEPYEIEHRIVVGDTVKWVRERAELDFDKKGALLGGFGTVQDITERKRVEEALRDSQEQVKADLYAMKRLHELGALSAHEENLERVLVEIVDAAIAIFSADFGTVQLLDPITSDLKIVAQRGFPDWWVEYWNGIGKGQGSCWLILKRGQRVIVEDVEQHPFCVGKPGLDVQLKAGVRACQSTLLVSRSGKRLGVFSTHFRTPHRPDDRELQLLDLLGRQASDIIDRAQHELALRNSRDELEIRVRERTAELARKNQELQEFAYVASHDLTEPLRKIQTFGDLLTKSAGRLGEQEKDYVSRMAGAANRMQELLDALLRYSRVETQARDFVLVRLQDIVHTVTADLEVPIRKIGAQLEIGFLPVLNCDPYQWRQVFQNLIANALKYHRSEVKTIIKVYGEEQEGSCRILVEDNGIGFDEKYLDKIFLPFQRLHGRNEYPGTGTGLAICKKIIERHGGTITASSTPGKGSTFVVTLPAGQVRS